MRKPKHLPDLPHVGCPANNIWSGFKWSKEPDSSESCQCQGCGQWQSADYARQLREEKKHAEG